MFQIITFSAVGIALYLLTDQLITFAEKKRGAPLENRSIIFFVIILVLSMVTFNSIQYFFAHPEDQPEKVESEANIESPLTPQE